MPMKFTRVLAGCVTAAIVLADRVGAQCQSEVLLPPDSAQSDRFGSSVSVDGSWAVVGKPGDSEIEIGSGAAYVYSRVGSLWVFAQKLKATVPTDGAYFGASVAISGDVLVVGAPHDPGTGIYDSGAVHVFERSGSTWTETGKLVANDAVQGMEFGTAVDVDGTRVIVGVPQVGPGGSLSGSAYVCEQAGSVWQQTEKLVPDDPEFGAAFGWSVSVSGDRIAVGCIAKDGPAGTAQGAAYAFEYQAGAWAQTQELFAPDGVSGGASFGLSVCASGDRMLVGALKRAQALAGAGVVYAYAYQGGGWVQTQEFWPDDSHHEQEFGNSIGLSGSLASGTFALIGAAGDDDAAGTASGSAYVYRLEGSTWIQVGKLLAANGATGDLFGVAVGISGDAAFVGACQADDACPTQPTCNSGAVYSFRTASTAVQYGHCPSGAPCGNTDTHGGCRNSTGRGAILAAAGSGSVTTDDLLMETTHCPPGKLTLLYMGGGQVHVPFADGFRDVSGGGMGVFRFGGQAADAQGRAMRGPGLVAQSHGFNNPNGHIQAGQTWNFQVWYRDTVGPCGGRTNYTNGVQVAFTP
jgi:hypothetical protein